MKVIILDAGGTLIHPARSIGETYAELAEFWNVTLDPLATTKAFYAAFKNMGPRDPGSIPRDGDDRVWWRSIVVRALQNHAFTQSKEFTTYFEDVYRYYAQPEAWHVFPEVDRVLKNWQGQGITLALLSNWDARLHSVLNGHGLNDFFTHRFISAELGWVKPDPEIYRHITQTLDLPPEEILSIGDEMENDFLAPQAAGWRALLLNRPEHDLQYLMERINGAA